MIDLKPSRASLLMYTCLALYPDHAILYSTVYSSLPPPYSISPLRSAKGVVCSGLSGFRHDDRRRTLEPSTISRHYPLRGTKSASGSDRPVLADGLREREILLKNKENQHVSFHVVEAAKTTDMVDDLIQDQMATVSALPPKNGHYVHTNMQDPVLPSPMMMAKHT